MFNVNFTQSLSGELGRTYSVAETVSAGAAASVEEVVLASATTPMAMALDVSQAKLLALLSTVDVVVKINDAGTPTNIFTLEANTPFIWALPQGALLDTAAAAVTVDFVTLHVVNAGATAGVLYADALYDPTV